MTTCYLADSPDGCFQEHRRRLLEIRYPGELIPCATCKSARPNAEKAYTPEPDDPPGPRPGTMCRQGHLRSEHGRQQTKGRDIGAWVCKECDRIKYEKRKEREKYKCKDCGKLVSIGAVQCKKCRAKDKKAAQPTHCTIGGCRAKARRRGMCSTHYWKARGEAKTEQRRARHAEAQRRLRERAA